MWLLFENNYLLCDVWRRILVWFVYLNHISSDLGLAGNCPKNRYSTWNIRLRCTVGFRLNSDIPYRIRSVARGRFWNVFWRLKYQLRLEIRCRDASLVRQSGLNLPLWVDSVPSLFNGHWSGKQAPQEPHWLTSQSRGQAISHLCINGGFSTALQYLLINGWPLFESTQVAFLVWIPPPHWTGFEVIGSEQTLHLDTSHLYLNTWKVLQDDVKVY